MKRHLLLLLFVMLAAVSAARQRTRTERLMDEMRDPKSKYVFVAAHRGDWRNWPENSVEAMQSAIEMGVDIVEIDVAMTSDSVLIVMHDRRADRTTKAKGLVSDLKWTDLGKFRLRSGHGVTTKCRIPTLEELLLVCKDRVIVNIDANGWPYLDMIYDMLVRLDMLDQVIIKCGCEFDEAMKAIAGRPIMFMPMLSPAVPASVEKLHRFLDEYPCPAYEICMYNKICPSDIEAIALINERGACAWTDTLWDSVGGGYCDDDAVADPDRVYGKHLEIGSSIIQTDRPGLLIGYLKSKGLRKLRR